MRILHIATDYSHTAVYSSLFKEMKLLNELIVLTPASDEVIVHDSLNDNSCRVVQVPCEKPRMFGVQINSFKTSKYIIRNGYCTNINLIHAHYVLNDGSVAYKLHSKLNIPYVVSVRATCLSAFDRISAPHNYFTSLKVLIYSSAIVFQSPSALRLLLAMLPAFYHKNILGKYKIISNGVDKFWLDNIYTTNKKVSRNKFTVLTVASLEVNKNIISVCKAVSTLNKKGCSVAHYIVGALVDSSILSEIDSMPCSKYLGVKDRQDLMMLYRDVDVFVMVSHKETFGLVYVEAMSQGLPIVYTKGQGFDGQFDEGTAGYHASADSVAEIEDAILRVIDDYARISENVSVLCRKYDWSIIAGTYKHLYTDIIGNNIPERS